MLILQVAVGIILGGTVLFYLISSHQQKETLKPNINNFFETIFEIFGIIIGVIIIIALIIGLLFHTESTVSFLKSYATALGGGLGLVLGLYGLPLFILLVLYLFAILFEKKFTAVEKVLQFYQRLPSMITGLIPIAAYMAILVAWWPSQGVSLYLRLSL